MTMKHRIIAGIASALLLHGVVSSQDTKNKQDTPINKTCIITGKAIPGDAPTSKVRGAVLAFCCKRCKAKYDTNPRQYTDKVRALMAGGRGRQASGRARAGYGSGGNKIADPAAHTKAMAKPIFSGPQKGEKLRSFKVTGLRGDHKGKEYDPVARAGDDMQLLLFTKGSSGGRIVPLLSNQLGAIMKGSGKTWRASVVHLSDDPNEISKYAAKFQGRVGGFFDMGIAKAGAAGPGSYGLDRTVTHTFLFAKKGKVVHNLVFTQQVFFNEPHLLGAIADVMGVDHKTLGKWLDSNMSRTGRGGARPTITKEQKAFRKELGERIQKGEITREEAGRLYRAKFSKDTKDKGGAKRRQTRKMP
jgi:YHS domain-containing protein